MNDEWGHMLDASPREYANHQLLPTIVANVVSGPGENSQASSTRGKQYNGEKRRPRARSILQSVATEKRDFPVSKERGPPIAELPERSRSLGHTYGRRKRPSCDKHVLFPLTKTEASELPETESETNFGSGEIDMATNLDYFAFKDVSQVHLNSCQGLLSSCGSILQYLDELSSGYNDVTKRTNELQSACDTIIAEYNYLDNLATGITSNLVVFDNLERITRALNAPGNSIVATASFKGMLKDLDAGLEYVNSSSHKNFKDIDLYQMRFRQCMTRALTLAKDYFIGHLRDIYNRVQPQLTQDLNSASRYAFLYTKFANEGDGLSSIMKELQARSGIYADNRVLYNLYNECLGCYFGIRKKLVSPSLYEVLNKYTNSNDDICQVTRMCLSHCQNVFKQERKLFDVFFSSENDDYGADFNMWIFDLADPLYDTLRGRILKEGRVSKLCELTSTLLSFGGDGDIDDEPSRDAYVDVDPERSGQIGMDLAGVFQPILSDVQSKLVFRIQNYIDTEIVAYEPKADDLIVLGHRRGKKHRQSSSGTKADKLAAIEESGDGQFEIVESTDWYPPMEKAISLLSQIYQLINSAVFDDLAHRVVHECIISLQKAQDLAEQKLGTSEARLFFIKNLLILRAHIIDFDIDHVPSGVQIDFSGLQEVFSLITREGVNVASNRGLLNLAKAGVPKVVNDMLDAKEELYVNLKNAIHFFTEESVKSIVAGILKDPPSAEAAADATYQMKLDATTEFPRIHHMIETYIDDLRTIDILIDSIQDLVIQTYQDYYNKIIQSSSREDLERASGLSGRESVMEPDTMAEWFGVIVRDLHTKRKLSSATSSSVRGHSPRSSLS